MPNYGYLNLNRSFNAKLGNFNESIKTLKKSRLMTFSSQQPDVVMGYELNSEGMSVSLGMIEMIIMKLFTLLCFLGKNLGLVLYGELNQKIIKSLQTSIILCGGLSTLIFLFARVCKFKKKIFLLSLY